MIINFYWKNLFEKINPYLILVQKVVFSYADWKNPISITFLFVYHYVKKKSNSQTNYQVYDKFLYYKGIKIGTFPSNIKLNAPVNND